MMGHDVYFDIASFRVGWSESTCDYTALVAAYTEGDWTPPAAEERIVGSDDDDEAEDDDDDEESEYEQQPGDTDDADQESDDDNDGVADDEENVFEPSGNYTEPGAPFCGSMTCQAGMIAGVVFVVTFFTIKMVRGSPSGPIYEVADHSELELQPGSFVSEKRNREFRDHDDDGESKFT